MSEDQNPPSDLPSPREKGEESYDPSQSTTTKKKVDPQNPTELPPTREEHEGVYAG